MRMMWQFMFLFALALLLWLSRTHANALGLTVRWEPSSSDEEVTGYYVYVRAAGKPYCIEPYCNQASPDGYRLDVGLPPQDPPEEPISFLIPNLDNLAVGCPYYLALTAYDADRRESYFSNELYFRAGVCEASQDPTLFVKRLKIKQKKRGRMTEPVLIAAEVFSRPYSMDPTSTGVALDIKDAAGEILYRAIAASDEMLPNSRRTLFRLGPSGAVATPGLLLLSLRQRSSGTVRVKLKASASELASAFSQDQLIWEFWPDCECISARNLICETRDTSAVTYIKCRQPRAQD